ncbi:MAG: hypothetical protein QOJ77_2345 [Microbacteriaceae bacterium]|nr:hypothetical protein [Microbacteriaceae bacterium]
MTSTQLRLSGSSLDELAAQVLAEHGPRARIVSAERITIGGIGGFFARRHYEVTVELAEPVRRGAHSRVDGPSRAGIAALLDEADELEARIGGVDAPRQVSTGSELFAELMDELTFTVAADLIAEFPPAAAVEQPVPSPLTRPGDLVAVVGLGEDALPVARQMAVVAGGDEVSSGVWTAGGLAVDGLRRVEDRRTALEARADAVSRGCSVFLAVGVGLGGGVGLGAGSGVGSVGSGDARILGGIRPDQVWVVVDAGRKAEDTARWVRAVASVVPVDAVAVIRQDSTSTPETVDALGLPIGWFA